MPETQKQPKSRKLLWGLLGCLLAPIVVFVLFSESASYVRIPEELKSAPITFDGTGKAEAKRDKPRTSARSAVRTGAPSPVFMSYDDYLNSRLARDPSIASAKLYLELSRQFYGEKINESFDMTFDTNFRASQAVTQGKFTPPQLQWLRAHADFLNLIQRCCKSGELPTLTREERLAYLQQMKTEPPGPSSRMLYTCEKMMMFESLRLLKDHHYAEGRQAAQDGIQLALMERGDESMIGGLVMVGSLDVVCRAMAMWIKDPKVPGGELATLLESFDRLASSLNLSERKQRAFTYFYLECRANILFELEKPTWRLPMYGWDRKEHPEEYITDLVLPVIHNRIQVPDLSVIIPKSLAAMRNRRLAPEALREYDRVSMEYIELMKLPWGEFSKEVQTLEQDMRPSPISKKYLLGQIPSFMEIRSRTLLVETGLNLRRVGLALRVDPEKILAKRNDDLTSQPHHPWLDPYGGAPLHADLASSPTLIWSVGPDCEDQHGQLEYDPSNGTISGGDITLRVPAR